MDKWNNYQTLKNVCSSTILKILYLIDLWVDFNHSKVEISSSSMFPQVLWCFIVQNWVVGSLPMILWSLGTSTSTNYKLVYLADLLADFNPWNHGISVSTMYCHELWSFYREKPPNRSLLIEFYNLYTQLNIMLLL